MALVGPDGRPVATKNPFAEQKLEDFAPMTQAEMLNMISTVRSLLAQRVPLVGNQVAFEMGDFVRFGRTLQTLMEAAPAQVNPGMLGLRGAILDMPGIGARPVASEAPDSSADAPIIAADEETEEV